MTENSDTTIQTPTRKKRIGKKKAVWIGAAAVAALTLGGVGTAFATGGIDGDNDNLTGTSLEQASAAALAETGAGEVTEAEQDNVGYEVEVRLTDGTEVDVYLDESYAVRDVETDDETDDDNDDLTGASLEQASAAALAETGAGEVTDAEQDNVGYEVEVRLTDGTEVDVYLDENYEVRGVDTNDETKDND